ncbi:GlxA family transcriptional regulator [Stenotrophomonas maltophilia]|uniref:GlxA family transcriptional regulator n=1 Tax=Stenotrophomonas maltophilia TaxID=40324 RepID=UPI003200C3EE|nr:GlxA family transcriptional regulator [Stenotrophomonas maltophilia]
MERDASPLTIAVLALDGVQLLDVAGPLDVFAEANAQVGREVYHLRVVSSRHGPIRTSSGAQLIAQEVIGREPFGSFDTLLVAGSPKVPASVGSAAVLQWLAETATRCRRFGSVCSGAFLLAQAGLLGGKRITTHWAWAQQLASQYPDVIVEEDSIHVKDGSLRTAAGVTAGLDLALSLVEEDLGPDVAISVASQLVMFFRRPGGQMQFSRKGASLPSGRAALQELQRWVAANPELDHSVANLADRMGLSTRHLSRLFRNEVGVTPAAWVEEARIHAARQLLETGSMPPKQVAQRCGFTDVDVLRRAFVRHVGVSPADYRRHFVAAGAVSAGKPGHRSA